MSMFDEYDQDRDDEDSSIVECKRCGKGGLHWEQEDDGRWSLYTSGYQPHKCDESRVAKDVMNDFDAV